ncbi:hypothetical protein pipiens_001096 [Culex pipiens pipiens]|uniref:Uncharacterized protein n=1 Tax=Culex pipiens pipiens TaxID=38569 RepID=A0ABD1CMJ9_CULPP
MMHQSRRQQQPPQQPPPPPTPAATGPGPGGGGKGGGPGGTTDGPPRKGGIPIFRNNRSASSSRINSIVVGPKVDTGRRSVQQQQQQHHQEAGGGRGSEAGSDLDHIDEDMFSKVPKMELLKVNYVNLKNDGVAGSEKKKTAEDKKAAKGTVAAAAPTKGNVANAVKKQLTTSSVNLTSNAGNGSTSNLSDAKAKYLVYKKHNGFGSNTSIAEIGAKLQYINDTDLKSKNGKKKYALFDNKKKNKLETVQYYFDSRSYERYVDNKLYGTVGGGNKEQQPPAKPEAEQKPDPKPQNPGDVEKRQSWDLRTNRPSMLRVINQSTAAKKPTPENNQQPAKESRALSPIESQPAPSLPSIQPLLSRQHSSSVIALNRKIVSKNPAPPSAVIAGGMVRENVHRFEKNKAKSDEMSAKQQKYLVHKRLSARYKAEESALSIAAAANATPTQPVQPAVKSVSPPPQPQIIDGHNGHSGSTETIDFETTKKQEVKREPIRVRSKSLERTLSDDDMSTISAKSSKTTCGYKNCKFPNCPMSSSSSSSASSTVSSSSCSSSKKCPSAAESHKSSFKCKEKEHPEIICGKRTSIVINDSDSEIFLNNALNDKLNNSSENVRVISSKIKEIDLETNRMIIEKCVEPITEITETVLARQKFWNQQNQRNIKLKNNPQHKPYDDKVNINNKIKNEDNNSIKIFITNQVPSKTGSQNSTTNLSEPVSLISTSASGSSASSAASTVSSNGAESDKDDGYYDQSERSLSPAEKQPLSIVSTVSTGSTVCSDGSNMSSVTCGNGNGGNRYTSKTSIRLGCEGPLFWNNNFFEDLDSGQSLGHNDGDNNSTGSGTGSTGSGCCNNSGSCCCCCRRRRSIALGSNSCIISSIDVGGGGCNGSVGGGGGSGSNGANGGCSGGNNGVVLRKAQLGCQCGMAQHNSKIDGFTSRPRSIEGPPDSGISISSDTIIASSDSDLNLQSQTDSDERKLKRGHVLAELLETERIYVAEMGSILKVSVSPPPNR